MGALSDFRQAVTDVLTNAGIKAYYAMPPTAVNPPCAVLQSPDQGYVQTAQSFITRLVTFDIVLIAGPISNADIDKKLDDLINTAWNALDADGTWESITASGSGQVSVGTAAHLAATITLSALIEL